MVIKKIRRPKFRNEFSFIDCINIYFKTIVDASYVNCNFLYYKAGLFFSLTFPKKNQVEYIDLTHIYSDPTIMKELIKSTGYSFHWVEKFGGVYNHDYFKYKLMEQLSLNKPIIARFLSNNKNWGLISDYNINTDEVAFYNYYGDNIINDWYETIMEFIIIGDKNYLYNSQYNCVSAIENIEAAESDPVSDYHYNCAAYMALHNYIKARKGKGINKNDIFFQYIESLYYYKKHAIEFLKNHFNKFELEINMVIEIYKEMFQLLLSYKKTLKFKKEINDDDTKLILLLKDKDKNAFEILKKINLRIDKNENIRNRWV